MIADPQKLKIVYYPDPVLRKVAAPIEEIDDSWAKIAEKMCELMREAEGVGLAAPQVGLSKRMFVANWTGDSADDLVFINPELKDAADEVGPYEEGCLSIPEVRGEVRRPLGITIEAQNLMGERFTMTSDELPARIWQHEYDHLEGVLILDRMGPMEKLANRRLIKDLEKRFRDRKGYR